MNTSSRVSVWDGIVSDGSSSNAFILVLVSVIGVVVIIGEMFPTAPTLNIALMNKSSTKYVKNKKKSQDIIATKNMALMYHESMFLFYGLLFWLIFLFAPSHPLFLILGTAVFIRQFEEKHEMVHYPASMQYKSPLYWVRWFEVVTSPFQLSVRDAGKIHLGHHQAHNTNLAQSSSDPDAYLVEGPFLSAAINAFSEPEQGLVRFLISNKQYWLDFHQITTIIWKSFQCFILILFIENGIVFLAITRILNASVWIIFHYSLHHEALFSTGEPLWVPLPIRIVWHIMFGGDNLNAIMFHALHHEHPSIPADSLHTFANHYIGKEEYPVGL